MHREEIVVSADVHAGQFGYKREDMVTLTDDQKNPRGIPTRDNMVCVPQLYFINL